MAMYAKIAPQGYGRPQPGQAAPARVAAGPQTVHEAMLALADDIVRAWGTSAHVAARIADADDKPGWLMVTDFGRKVPNKDGMVFHPVAVVERHALKSTADTAKSHVVLLDGEARGAVDYIVVPGATAEFDVLLLDKDMQKTRAYGTSSGGMWRPPKRLEPELAERLRAGWAATSPERFGAGVAAGVPVDFTLVPRVSLRFHGAPAGVAVVRSLRLLQKEDGPNAKKSAPPPHDHAYVK